MHVWILTQIMNHPTMQLQNTYNNSQEPQSHRSKEQQHYNLVWLFKKACFDLQMLSIAGHVCRWAAAGNFEGVINVPPEN